MPKKFDVIVVGAGPAGATAALLCARNGLSTALIERGEYEGSKNMFGGAFYHGGLLDNIVPDFINEAPWERFVTRQVITMLTPQTSLSLDFKDANFGQPPYNALTLLRSKFDKWYAQKAVEAGALLIPETVVDDVLKENGKIVGVKARREKGELLADIVVAADGVNSLLALKAGMRKEFTPHQLSVSVKELLALPPKVIEERFGLKHNEGVANLFIGSFSEGMPGGGFLYTNKDSISLGIVASLDGLEEKKISVADLMESFKQHPYIKDLIKDASLKEYSGHLVPEAGLAGVPKLYSDGILLTGDAAGLVCSTGLTLEGMNFAVASGIAAAETIKKAKGQGDFSRKTLAHYQTLLEAGFPLKDLRTFRFAPSFLASPNIYKLYPEIAANFAERLFRVDGKPRKKFWSLAQEVMKGKISRRRLIREGIRAGRALLL